MYCENPRCGCESAGIESEGRHYCSAECASNGNGGDSGECECGHPECE
jgi:hypothetical protein